MDIFIVVGDNITSFDYLLILYFNEKFISNNRKKKNKLIVEIKEN